MSIFETTKAFFGVTRMFRAALAIHLILLIAPAALAQETEPMGDTDSTNNQDGSLNTNTVGSTVSSNNNSKDESVSNTYNGAGSSSSMPVGSAIAPSYMSNGMETCLQGTGQALQTGLIGYTSGSYQNDPNCERRRDSAMLSALSMKVAAIARLCQGSPETFKAMLMSGTPCPMISTAGQLVVGKRAFLLMKTQPSLYIPEYGEVRMRKTATWSKKTPTPIYNKTQQFYNQILAIGMTDENESEDTDTVQSVSSKFRSSKR